jgi:hypothetical protein
VAEQEASWRRRKTDLRKTAILWFWDWNLERCRKKLEREAKHATAEIFWREVLEQGFLGVAGRAAEEV